VDWTQEDLDGIHTSLKAVLTRGYPGLVRKLLISKQMTKPLEEIMAYTASANAQPYNKPAYRLYSAHDTNIANFLM